MEWGTGFLPIIQLRNFPRSHSCRWQSVTSDPSHPFDHTPSLHHHSTQFLPAAGLALGSGVTELNEAQSLSQKSSRLKVDKERMRILVFTPIEGGTQARSS